MTSVGPSHPAPALERASLFEVLHFARKCNWHTRERPFANSSSCYPDIGANASAEEAGDDLADEKVKVNNIVASFRLQSTAFDKKGFLTYLKGTIPIPRRDRSKKISLG